MGRQEMLLVPYYATSGDNRTKRVDEIQRREPLDVLEVMFREHRRCLPRSCIKNFLKGSVPPEIKGSSNTSYTVCFNLKLIKKLFLKLTMTLNNSLSQ